MTNETVDKLFETEFTSRQKLTSEAVDMLTLIDTGIILSVDVNGRAKVASNKALGSHRVIYENVEVIGIGNNKGGFIVDGVNCTCLILAPRTPVEDVSDQKISLRAPAYDKRGVKALPITNGYSTDMRVLIDDAGDFHITLMDKYHLDFTHEKIIYQDAGWGISLGTAGELFVNRKTTESGLFEYSLSDAGLIKSYTGKNKDFVIKAKITDTSAELEVGMGTPSEGSEEDDWGNKLPVYPNTYKLSFTGGQCSISHVDDQGEELTTITIGVDGGLTVSTPADVSLQANAVTLETKDALSITSGGDTSIEASGNVAVSAGTGKKIILTGPQGGKVEIE